MALIRLFALWLIAAGLPIFASASEQTFVLNGVDRQSLNGHLEYLEDHEGTLSIEQVSGSDGFKPYTTAKKLGYDYKGAAFWVRFHVDSSAYEHPAWFLTYDYEHIGNLQVFYPVSGGWKRVELDENAPANEGRTIKTTQYTVEIPTASKATWYYARFAPDGHFFPMSLSATGVKGLVESTQFTAVSKSLFFGALGAIWFYNLALLIFLRDKLYAYYIYYLGCFTAAFVYIYGFIHLGVSMTPIWQQAFAAAGYLAIHGLVVFTRHFLSLAQHSRWVNWYLLFFQWVLLLGAIGAFFQPIGQPFRNLNILILLTVPVIAVVGVMRSRTYPPARLYSLGWALFAAALISLAARSLNLLPVNAFTTYGVMLASVWEAALFSLALGYRVKLADAQVAEERVRVAEVEREATRARERFLSMVSHELRSPLTSVSFGLDMLELRSNDKKQSEAVLRIRRAADSLEGQLRDLLTLATGNHGSLEIRPVRFDATQLVVDYAEDRRADAQGKGLAFNVVVPQHEVLVVADSIRLAQVLTNLISNAIKYTDKGCVTVTLDPFDPSAGVLRFSVVDTGIGIPGVAQPLVFKPFSRFDAMDRGQQGIGIGLAVVKTVVDHLGGSITVRSEEGAGTSFAVEIPVVPDTPTAFRGSGNVNRILVVDDREDVLASLVELMAELDYTVDQALGSAIGANLLAANCYDAVLIDLDMPVKPGRELAAEVRRGGGPNTKVWMIAFSAAMNELKDTLWPFDAFLVKPVNRHTLKAAIEAGIAGSETRRATVEIDAATLQESAP